MLPGLDLYLTAYRELRYDKPMGFGVGPIPWSSIDRWATRHGLDNDDLAILEHHLRAMETALDTLAEGRKDAQ